MTTTSEGQADPAHEPTGEAGAQPPSALIAEIIARRPLGLPGYLLTKGWLKATPEQLGTLRRMGYGDCGVLTKREASQLIRQRREENRRLPATERQQEVLRGLGLWRADMTRGEAAGLIAKSRRERAGWRGEVPSCPSGGAAQPRREE